MLSTPYLVVYHAVRPMKLSPSFGLLQHDTRLQDSGTAANGRVKWWGGWVAGWMDRWGKQ